MARKICEKIMSGQEDAQACAEGDVSRGTAHQESSGIEKKRGVVYDDLDHLAGTWSKKDAAEFERATAVFEKVDEEMWK